VAVIVAVIGLVIYLLVRAATRKNRQGAQVPYLQEKDKEDKTS